MSAINLKQILPKTSRILSFKEILGEIERVQGVVEQIPTLTIENSKVLGTQDGYDIYGTSYFSNYITFCIQNPKNRSQVIAYLSVTDGATISINGIDYNESKRIWVDKDFRGIGLATILYAFVVKKLSVPLLSDNELTDLGMKQLDKMIDSKHFDISYYNKDTNQLSKEKPEQLFSNLPNPYRVLIETGMYGNSNQLFGHGYRILSENWYYKDSLDWQ